MFVSHNEKNPLNGDTLIVNLDEMNSVFTQYI
jgi:hypothetical protein